MRMLRTLLVVAALAALTASTAHADTYTPRVDRREARPQARIRQGGRSGEAARLRMGERHIRRMERRDKADGVVTPRERRQLNRAENGESRRIAHLKHNRRAI